MLWRVVALLGTALGGGCFGPAVPSGVACSPDGHCPGTQTCDLVTRVCDGAATDAAPGDTGGRDGPPGDVSTGVWTLSSLGLGTSTDEDPTITGDRLLLVFVKRFGSQDYQLYQSSRTSVTAAWSTPAAITELNTPSQETSPELSTDGLDMYFTSNRVGGGGRDVWITTRPDRSALWGAPTTVTQLSTVGDDVGIGISPDRQRAVLDTDLSGERDLYAAVFTGSAWGSPVLSTALSDMNRDEGSPTIAPDGTVLFHVLSGGSNFNVWIGVPQMGGGYATSAVTELAGYSDPFVLDATLILCARNGQLFQATR